MITPFLKAKGSAAPAATPSPPAPDSPKAVAELTTPSGLETEIRELGSANFLFYDGEHLFVHADRRRFETEDGLTEPREPGLNIRSFGENNRGDRWHTRGASIEEISAPLHLFASVQLDSEGWSPLPRGTAMLLKDGEIVSQCMS